jgi:hypothetical protein
MNYLQMVLQNAYRLKGSSFGISEQYPAEINNRRKNLYPIIMEAKQQRHHDSRTIQPPWFGDDPCRGRFIDLPGAMCELCPCPCCKWGGELHTLSTLTGLSSGGMYCSKV